MNFNQMYGNAKFIKFEQTDFPYVRKIFNTNKKLAKAVLRVSALGFCEIYLNNQKITDDLYITPLSEYNARTPEEANLSLKGDCFFSDELNYTIYAGEYDVTRFIVDGDNCFGLILAGGWYRSGFDKHKSFRNYGDLKLCYNITVEYKDGTIFNVVSDENCKYNASFLTNAGIFHEDQDERKEIANFSDPQYNDETWFNAKSCDAPDAEYLINDCPPNRIIKYVAPKLIKQEGNTKTYALEENITGFPIVCGESARGDKIICTYGETLDDDLSVNEFHSYCQNTEFISDGRLTHNLRFTWHGFQYFSVTTTGDVNKLHCEKCAVVFADIKNTSEFDCNLDTLNFLYTAYVRGQNENFQCGVPTDCPQIERKGYTGDGQLLCDAGMNLFDSKKLYKKWMRDIANVQDEKTGFVHNTAPCFIGCSGGPGGWGMAIINVPYEYYKTFGDKSVLETYYGNMLKYCEFLDNEAKGGLVRFTDRRGACLGDWAGPIKPYLPEPFVNTCLYIEALLRLTEIAEVLEKNADAEKIIAKAERLKSAVKREFYNEEDGNYCGNVQASNAFALNIGLGDDRTLFNLVEKYKKDGCFDTGIFGTKILVKVLFEKGYGNYAVDLLDSKKEISYYSWQRQGATTLWEAWQDPRSYNHPMFGAPVIYLFKEILGVKQTSDCGFSEIAIKPAKLEKLTRVSGSLKTCRGKIAVSYVKNKSFTRFSVDIPKNVAASFEYDGVKKDLVAGRNEFDIRN